MTTYSTSEQTSEHGTSVNVTRSCAWLKGVRSEAASAVMSLVSSPVKSGHRYRENEDDRASLYDIFSSIPASSNTVHNNNTQNLYHTKNTLPQFS